MENKVYLLWSSDPELTYATLISVYSSKDGADKGWCNNGYDGHIEERKLWD